jgi:hypothetical protein
VRRGLFDRGRGAGGMIPYPPLAVSHLAQSQQQERRCIAASRLEPMARADVVWGWTAEASNAALASELPVANGAIYVGQG